MVYSHVFVICVTMFPHLEKDSAFSVFAGLRVWNIIYFPCSVDVPVQQGVGLHCIHHHSVLVIFKMSVLSLDGIKREVGLHQHLCFYASIPHVFSTRQFLHFFPHFSSFFLCSASQACSTSSFMSTALHSYRCKTSQLYFTACNLCKVCLTFPV